jgi:glycyl-tRNA synthetase beta chain
MNLLIELGCEELPALALSALAKQFADNIASAFQKRGLKLDRHRALWTPRRLAVQVHGLEANQADQNSERRGPALAAAFDSEGKPSKALVGFAASCDVDVAALEKLETDKGAWMVHRALVKGRPTSELVPEVLREALGALAIPKPMRWSDSDHAFLRPVHWLVVLLNDQVIATSAFGVTSDRITYGHRFHAPQAFSIAHADDYELALRQAHVEIDPAARAAKVTADVLRLAQEIGGVANIREELLDEVVNLTEWPVPIRCAIPAEFMRLPAATIVTTIETHQRYFPIRDAKGELLPAFIGVANIDSLDASEIRKGYERVVRPRLADADFFYQQDLKTPLASYQDQLKAVTFQAKLGSVWDKSVRVSQLAKHIAPNFGAESAQAEKAALLAKCDLMSRMVGEFPELQGEMGKTYAALQGESVELAASLDEVYCPRNAADGIAKSALGRTLAIAERLDTLAGIFAVGLKPTGNKDAFALRRAALGLARTLIEGQLKLDLPKALQFAVSLQPASAGAKPELSEELYQFIIERLRAYYGDRGIDASLLDAVAERKPSDLLDFDLRLRACQAFKALPESAALAAANKRIGNLLKKSEGSVQSGINVDLFENDAERSLFAALQQSDTQTAPMFAKQHYVEGLTALASLSAPVNKYFDDVMVMADDAKLRVNRLATLKRVSDLFLNVADVSVLG